MNTILPFTLAKAGLVFLLTGTAVFPAAAQTIGGFQNPAGYRADLPDVFGSAFAVGPDGKFAVGQDDFGGNATITVYDKIGTGRTALRTFAAPSGSAFQFFGGLTWKNADTLVFSENGPSDTVFAGSVASGSLVPLAPFGSLPNVAQIAFKPGDVSGTLYAGLANGPGANAVYTVAGGTVSAFAVSIGNGYLGGLAFRPSDAALFVGDTNDPFFSGKAGQAIALNADGSAAGAFSLAGGGGNGISGLTFDTAGNLYATTGGSITLLPAGSHIAQNFGNFTGPAPFGYFPGDLAFFGGDFSPFGGGTGTLLVNGGFTNVSGFFTLTPTAVPEPSAPNLFAGSACVGLLLRRRSIGRGRK